MKQPLLFAFARPLTEIYTIFTYLTRDNTLSSQLICHMQLELVLCHEFCRNSPSCTITKNKNLPKDAHNNVQKWMKFIPPRIFYPSLALSGSISKSRLEDDHSLWFPCQYDSLYEPMSWPAKDTSCLVVCRHLPMLHMLQIPRFRLHSIANMV